MLELPIFVIFIYVFPHKIHCEIFLWKHDILTSNCYSFMLIYSLPRYIYCGGILLLPRLPLKRHIIRFP